MDIENPTTMAADKYRLFDTHNNEFIELPKNRAEIFLKNNSERYKTERMVELQKQLNEYEAMNLQQILAEAKVSRGRPKSKK